MAKVTNITNITNTNVTASTDALEATTESAAAIYIGDGAYVPGIPARSLTAEEWGELPVFTQQSLIAQGLYRLTEGTTFPSVEAQPVPVAAPVTTG